MEILGIDRFDGERLRDVAPTAVLFLAAWCGFCRRFQPAYLSWAGAERGERGFGTGIADISDDEADPRWETFGIDVVPTLIAFRGGKEIWRKDGVLGYGLEQDDLEACAKALGTPPHGHEDYPPGPESPARASSHHAPPGGVLARPDRPAGP